MSVPSTSKKAPTPGPAGLSSTSCTMWAGSAMAAGAGTIPPPPSPGRAVRLPARLRAWVQSAPVAALPSPSPPMEDPDRWPPADGRRVVFLLDASSDLERRLIDDRIARSRPAEVTAAGYDVVSIPPSRRQRRRRRRRSDARLEGTLAVGDDPLLAPLRVAWLPPKRDGVPRARLPRLLPSGDPRDPGRLRQAQVLRRHPDRCCVVLAAPAPPPEVRARWHRGAGTLAALGQRDPLVFLPSHKSNLDSLVLKYALYENGLPPNHTAGGINMNFFPMGAIMRRTGIFFIRRSFKDNDVYKLVLRQYIDYLIEKRFPLEWYMEGTRSRSGKLMPPRFGLLAYVVDAYRRGKSDDVLLIPVSIAYDQIQDVAGYAAEERGGTKQPESFGWFLRFVRALRRQYGEIYIRFGEPLSLARALGPPDPGAEPDPNEQSLVLQKTAFDVAVRINRVTPITAISLVTLTLLGTGNRALSVDETIVRLRNLLDYVRRRNLPTAGDLRLDTRDGVQHALDALVENGVVTCFAEGEEPVYLIGPEKHLIASYYRNTIIHFFVTGAIAELALVRAAEVDVADPAAEFWEEAMRLRDLLKFEFFFAEKDAFREELRDEIRLHDPDWESRLGEGPAAIEALLRRFRPFSAHRVLRPFVEAYRAVADALERRSVEDPLGEEKFLKDCLALGQQYVLQRRILSPESVSQVLFANALSLARNRGLVEPGAADLAERRRGFAEELRNVARRVDAVDALVAARHTGLID